MGAILGKKEAHAEEDKTAQAPAEASSSSSTPDHLCMGYLKMSKYELLID